MQKEPKQNEVYHLCQLMTGDRFYCKSDEKKTVFELRFHTMIKVKSQYKKFSQCKNDLGDKIRFDANRIVIFLRRTRKIHRRIREYSIDQYFA